MQVNKTFRRYYGNISDAMQLLKILGNKEGYMLGTDKEEEDKFILQKLEDKTKGVSGANFDFVMAQYDMNEYVANKLMSNGVIVYDNIDKKELKIISQARAILTSTIGS